MKRWIRASVLTWLLAVPATAAGQVCEAGLRGYAVTGQQVHNHVADEHAFETDTELSRDGRVLDIRQDYGFQQAEVRFDRGTERALGLQIECGPLELRGFRLVTADAFQNTLTSGETLRWYRIKDANILPVFNETSCRDPESGAFIAELFCASPIGLSAFDRYRTLDGSISVRLGGWRLGLRLGEQAYRRRTVETQRALLNLSYRFRQNGELVSRGDLHFENDITLDFQESSRVRFVGPLVGSGFDAGPLRLAGQVAYVRQFRRDRARFVDIDDIYFELFDTDRNLIFHAQDILLDGLIELDRNTPRWGAVLDAEGRLRLWKLGVGAFLSYRDIPTNVELTNPWGTGSNKAPRALEVEYRPRQPIVFTGAFLELRVP